MAKPALHFPGSTFCSITTTAVVSVRRLLALCEAVRVTQSSTYPPRVVAATILVLAAMIVRGQDLLPALPTGSMVLPAEILGPDDLIEIMVPYCAELSRTFRVGSDGTLTLPLLKHPIKAAGLLPPQVAKTIEDALKQEQVMADPIVSVSAIEYRSRPVSIIGAVNHPLTFQATGETSLLDAITKAGGFAPNVGADVLVTTKHRNGQGKTESTVRVIPVKNLTTTADSEYNVELRGGEEIRVPEASKIFVAGNVNRPGAFAMQGDADTTVIKALALSSGLAPYAGKDAYIYRIHAGGGGRDEFKIPLSRIMKRKAPDMALKADDILYVPDNNGKRMTNKVLNEIAGFGASTATGLLIYR
jgi:polysaccharide export outer membrane protein